MFKDWREEMEASRWNNFTARQICSCLVKGRGSRRLTRSDCAAASKSHLDKKVSYRRQPPVGRSLERRHRLGLRKSHSVIGWLGIPAAGLVPLLLARQKCAVEVGTAPAFFCPLAQFPPWIIRTPPLFFHACWFFFSLPPLPPSNCCPVVYSPRRRLSKYRQNEDFHCMCLHPIAVDLLLAQ